MKSIKKLLAIVIAIALIVSCFAINASASTQVLIDLCYDGTIHCTGSQDGNDAQLAKTKYGISWDATEKAWIFDNTNITEQDLIDADKSMGILFAGECNVIIKGTCNVCGIVAFYSVENWEYNEVKGEDEKVSDAILTIKGDGTLNLTAMDSCIWSEDTVKFEGTVNVNAVSNDAYVCVHANQEIIFDLDKGGKVTAETKSSNEYACAFNASSADTIILNSDDGTKVTFPVNGLATKLNNHDWDWAITESDGTTLAKKATVENVFVEYEIEETADDATWTKGSEKGQSITSTSNAVKFVSVSVDGKEVDDEYYTVSGEDSTVITFTPAFLETLSVGDHEVVITSTDGDATGTLTIKEKPASPEPTTEPEEETTTEPVEEETTTEPVEEETTTEAPEEEPEVVADTSDKTVIGAFVALGTLASAGYVSLKKKED